MIMELSRFYHSNSFGGRAPQKNQQPRRSLHAIGVDPVPDQSATYRLWNRAIGVGRLFRTGNKSVLTCSGPTLTLLPMLEGASLKRTAFGPYQVRDLIAVSGMGVVYRAWDPRLECLVAIKLVNEKTVSDESARQQLLKEARIASSLDHQNICRIKHVEEADGQTGIVMELVEGLALDRLFPPGAGLPFDEVVRYG